jgi:CheY-like chemotaxis protein
MKTRILIVDDEPEFTSMMKMSLELEGNYDVQEENNALHAVHAAREFEPNVVLLDVMMPEISGIDVAASFSNDDRLKNTPIVFLSALVRQNATPSFATTMSSRYIYLPKPVSVDSLLDGIKKAATLGQVN